MILKGTTIGVLFLTLFIISGALHIQEEQNTELRQLKAQQQYLGQQVGLMLQQSSSVKQRLAEATDDQDRVQILEEALNTQKQQVFDLKNKLIYPFNESTTACQQLTDQQKIRILDELYQTRSDLQQLQEINSKLDQTNSQVQNVSKSIEKQFILLQQIQAILKIKCKQNLSPTIYQSNLNAKNWILGPQTMSDLQQEYAQRALIFHNVTNCPMETPFFSLSQQICIQCFKPDYLFNMYTKQCSRCEGDQQLDEDKKKCRAKPHYTNFTNVQNWNLDGGQLPAIDPKLTPCPDSKPYFNGVICVKCQLPMYWSVAPNLCKQCQLGYKFDMNTKQCEEINRYQLSLLQNTKWISQDLTKVIEERVQVLELNQTSGQYHYCQTAMKPFYDGTTCIFCKIFDMDSLRCVQPPQGLVYDDNMKKFVTPQSSKETSPNAEKYISKTQLKDTTLQNCNSTHPYWDGIACVYCARPFDKFKVEERKCVVCNADQIYVQAQHKCVMRNKIHISQNFNRLLATQTVSIPDYKQKLIDMINNNPDSIVYPCPKKTDYSNITTCFPCKENQYFNVQTYKCVICDGTYIDTNHTCKTKVYIFTNMKAGKIIDMGDKTVEGENQKVAEFLKTHPQSYVCPLDKPYAIDNTTCGTCPQLFSYSTLKCTQCPQYHIFVPDEKQCRQAKMLVNFTNPKTILVTQTQTLSSFQASQQKIRTQYPKIAKVCSGEKPYTSSRDFCFNCSQKTPYFNYTKKECQSCPQHYIFDAESVKCVQNFYMTLFNNNSEPQMLGYRNYTLATYKEQQQQLKKKNPYQNCTQAEPYGTLKGCVQCSEPTSYFNIKKKQCANAKFLINFPQIKADYIVPADKTLENYKSAQQKFVNQTQELTIICQKEKPYTNDKTYCFNCAEDEHFNFQSKSCERCPQTKAYVNETKRCSDLFYVTNFTTESEKKMKGKENYTISDYKKQQQKVKANNPFKECPNNKPYGTANGCRDCVEPTPFFDIKRKVCANAKKLINFNGVGQKYIVGQDKQLKDYQEIQNNYKIYSQSLTVECDQATPYTSDRQFCFSCKSPTELFNFQSKKCQSCSLNSKFSPEKNQCLKLVYLTLINNDTEPRMIESDDYTMNTFKKDQTTLKEENPYENCTEETPFGTVDGCKQCAQPESYYDIKNRKCTSVKRVINFAELDENAVVTGQDKKIQDYKKDQQDFEKDSKDPVMSCPPQLPFTRDRNKCFVCEDSTPLFKFETKQCISCKDNESYNQETKKCVQKKFYSLLNPTTKANLIEDGNKTIPDYQKQQEAIKKQKASQQCPQKTPYASKSGCIVCQGTTQYFNIKTLQCQACGDGQKFFADKHKCLKVAYLTDLQNQNIMVTQNMSIQDAKKAQQEKAKQPGYLGINCTGDKPFATESECIQCSQPEKPYFNIQTLECVGCVPFYQYFQDNQCKDNIILINTKEMVGYIQVDNYTKYNIEKFNNFTFLQNDHVVDCPAEEPFYNDQICLNCPDSEPIFNLKDKKCQYIQVLLKSNVAAMKFYIEQGDQTLKALLNQIEILNPKVNIQFCPTDKPYLANNECISCPASRKYFNLGTQTCQTCGSNDKCFSV